MSPFVYPTDPRILDGLRECLELIRMGATSSPLNPLPPTIGQLAELLNSSYAASLETEEGRTVAFTVNFFGDPDPPFSYQMKEPLPLSPRNLTRLAVAVDPRRSRICVVPNGTALSIGGLIHLGEQFAFHGARQTLHQLSIRVLGPGILVLRYGGALLLTYQRGRFAFHCGPSARFSEFDIGTALSFRPHAGRTVEQLQVDLRFDAALVRIARTMLYQRHGGTLLILPHDADWEKAAPFKQYMPTTPMTIVKDANAQELEYRTKRNQLFQEVMQGKTRPEIASVWVDDMIRARFSWELEWLARLTATDGMTVITPDLTLLGFGVFFDTQDAGNITRVRMIDPYEDEEDCTLRALTSIGGARHQSAALTCRRFPGAIAVVASQDGSLSSMTWDMTQNVVVAFRHVELLLDV